MGVKNGNFKSPRDLRVRKSKEDPVMKKYAVVITLALSWLLLNGRNAQSQLYFRNSAGIGVMTMTQAGNVGISSTSPDAKLRIRGSSLTSVPYIVEPNNTIYATLYAEHYNFPPSTPDIHVAIEGVTKIRPSATDVRYRAGVHGVLVASSEQNWAAAGGLGFERTGTGQNWVAGVVGTINSVDIGGGLVAIAGRFVNSNAINAVDNFAIWAMGEKNYFSGKIGIGTTNPQTNLCISDLTVGGSYNLRVDGNGNVYRDASSERYKQNIRAFKDDFNKILQLQPKKFQYPQGAQVDIGYTAEEVDQLGLRDLVVYDETGRPDAIKYDKLALYLIEVIKELNAKISALEEERR